MEKITKLLELTIPVVFTTLGGVLFGTAIIPMAPDIPAAPDYLVYAILVGSMMLITGAMMFSAQVRGSRASTWGS